MLDYGTVNDCAEWREEQSLFSRGAVTKVSLRGYDAAEQGRIRQRLIFGQKNAALLGNG
jgi:hypothetical protein